MIEAEYEKKEHAEHKDRKLNRKQGTCRTQG
jgi:hypothetical protein